MTCAKGGWNPVGGGSTRQERKNKEKTCAELGRRRRKHTSKEKKKENYLTFSAEAYKMMLGSKAVLLQTG